MLDEIYYINSLLAGLRTKLDHPQCLSCMATISATPTSFLSSFLYPYFYTESPLLLFVFSSE